MNKTIEIGIRSLKAEEITVSPRCPPSFQIFIGTLTHT
jgi:hypothetical protein